MKNNILFKYLALSLAELKKVTWPTRAQIINHTLIVIAAIVVATSVTSVIDYSLSALVQYAVENGN